MQSKPLNERMSEKARKAISVSLIRYNKLISRIGNQEVAIVEGADDAAFYSTAFTRLNNSSVKYFFIANGKENVLKLRDLITASKDIPRAGGLVFFIDRDFDGLKSFQPAANTYVTPTYSIENILVCRTGLHRILLSDFKMSDADSIADVQAALGLFDRMITQYATALEEANLLIHHVRQESLKGNILASGSIDDQPNKFADLDANTLNVTKNSSGDELRKLIGIEAPLSAADLAKHKKTFESIPPASGWRGKFLIHLYRRFITFLCEDRNKAKPTFFSKGGGKVSLSVSTNSVVRLLGSACMLPACLTEFVADIEARKLT